MQSYSDHEKNVCALAEKNCPLALLKSIACLAAHFHDLGKLSLEFSAYMQRILELGEAAGGSHVVHSSAGGLYVEKLLPGTLVAGMVKTAIYSHHGLQDCISPETGKALEEQRREGAAGAEGIFACYEADFSEAKVAGWCTQAGKDLQELKQRILQVEKSGGEKRIYGRREFYLGMYERVLLSVLMDSDWTDTAAFFDGQPPEPRLTLEESLSIWETSIQHLESQLKELANKTAQDQRLHDCRQEISDACRDAALKPVSLYLLTVPTGAGKTLSGLRFALYHAKAYRKQRIVYVAPFHSILEQNADVIRTALGRKDIVLEHHCNVVQETEEGEEHYRRLTESWDSPVIVTTAVQVLNTLFSGRKMNLRRMYALCNSVIIFDEVQAIPVKCTQLFHLAVNFLTAFCNTTVVLCSATQPSLARALQYRVFESVSMVEEKRYGEAFRRTNIIDKTLMKPGGLRISELADFTGGLLKEKNKILLIVNTKACAEKLYDELKQRFGNDHDIYHLSTNMCPEHRKDKLRKIRENLETNRAVICVSTQLVEAGVDFSFQCVIRSLAGLDSVIQAAGRCNRNKEWEEGPVYIVKLSQEAENLLHLEDIRNAQEAMEEVLAQLRGAPETLGGDIGSREAITFYYERYFEKVSGKTNYPIEGVERNLVDLLSENSAGCRQYNRAHGRKPPGMLHQAFQTAGESFQVIEEDCKVEVVIPYNDVSKKLLESLESPYLAAGEKRRILRRLQGYTVGIAPWKREKLGNAVSGKCGGSVLALSEGYYSMETGVLEQPQFAELFF